MSDYPTKEPAETEHLNGKTTEMVPNMKLCDMDDPRKEPTETELLNGRAADMVLNSTSCDMGDKADDKGKKQNTRDQWKNKFDALLACVGFSVGLGNVWRFPYLCYKNGGGAFLLPYFICVLLAGIPMFFMEMALGQFMTSGGITAWNICPLFQGIGFATTILIGIVNIYCNVILAWAFYYLFSSFTTELPWSHCNNTWNTEKCRVANNITVTLMNATSSENISFSNYQEFNETSQDTYLDPVTEFWENKVLELSPGIEYPGGLKWDISLCLLLAWILIYLCIWKGIKSSGKVMYITATSPYLLMLILLIRGLTLPGAVEGIKFYLIPNWSRMLDTQVWIDAGTQIFFSYTISSGTMIAVGSYNKFHHNCWQDSLLFAVINSGTSIFAGFVIFPILGFMANLHGVDVSDVAEPGPGLAFIAYPKAVAEMPVAPLWSVVFFIMIILLGIDSQFGGVEGFITAIVDMFPHLLRKGIRRNLFVLGVCCMNFFIGLSMCIPGGMYVFQLFDYYAVKRVYLILAFFEVVAVAWIYGANRFYDDLEMMLGYRLNPYMKICWYGITPIFNIGLFGLCFYNYSDLVYNRTYHYPAWAIGIGWMIAAFSVFMIPIVAAVKIARASGSLKQRFQYLIRPRLQEHQIRPKENSKELDEKLNLCTIVKD